MHVVHTYTSEALGDIRRAAVAALFALDMSHIGDEMLKRLIEVRREEVKYFIEFLRRISSKLAERTPLSETELELVKAAQRVLLQREDPKPLINLFNRLAEVLEAILIGREYSSPSVISGYRNMLVEFINMIAAREERLLRVKP